MIALTNREKDIIGSLRAINWLMLLWNVEPILFPLDATITKLLKQYQSEFEELLKIAEEISQLSEIDDEMRSAIDDIASDSEGSYSSEYVGLLLSLYVGDRNLEKFHYNDVPLFHRELAKVFKVISRSLIDAILWQRVNYYDWSSNFDLPSPLPQFSRFFAIVYTIVPPNVALPASSNSLLTQSINYWLRSSTVQKALINNVEEKNGLTQVVKEVRNLDQLTMSQRTLSELPDHALAN